MSKQLRPRADDGGTRHVEDLAEPPDGMRRSVLSGVAWKGTSQIVAQLARLAVAVILARLLLPDEYGMTGMLLAVSAFVFVLSDLALGAMLVQRLTLSQVDCSTAFWTSIVAGTTFTVVTVALAGPISAFFREPDLAPMLRVLALSFLLSSVALTQSALLVRAMAFRSLEVRQIAAQLASGAAAIAVAALGYGAWAIVTQQIVRAVVSTLLVWRFSSWRPSVTFSVAALRSFAGFTSNVFGQNMLTQMRATTDNVLIGRTLGASALGAYALAYNIILVPFNRIAVPLAQVLYPALSRLQNDRDRVKMYWLRSVRTLAAISIPSLLGLIVLAPEFVDIVLGEAWVDAVPVIQLLAIVGLLQTMQFLNSSILQALDHTSVMFRWTLCSYVITLIAFVIGLQWGIVGLAAAYAISSFFTETVYAHITARSMGASVWTLTRAVSGVAISAGAMAFVVLGLRILLQHEGTGPGLRFLVLVPVGAILYVALVRLLAPEIIDDARGLLRRRDASREQGTSQRAEGDIWS